MKKHLLLALAIALAPVAALAQSATTGPTLATSVIANDGSTGTVINKLAKLTSSGAAVVTSTSDTDNAVGIVVSNAGTTGSAQIASEGVVKCAFDGTATPAHYVQISSTTAGACHDTGSATRPSSGGQVIGIVQSGGAGAGTYLVKLALGNPAGAGGGNVTTTGTPANGNLTKFSGSTSITNGDLSGDCTTSGALAVTCLATNGVAFNYGAPSTSTSLTVNPGSGSGLTGTTSLRYQTRGKQTFFSLTVTITANGTGATSIGVNGFPWTFNADCLVVGRATLGTGKMLQGYAQATTSAMTIWNYDNTYPASTGEVLKLSGVCENT